MQKRVAKVLIHDLSSDEYLLLIRADHPHFPNDPDLPGGTVEDGESDETTAKPHVTISWEHSGYAWVNAEKLVEKCRAAKDTYMHMVADNLSEAP